MYIFKNINSAHYLNIPNRAHTPEKDLSHFLPAQEGNEIGLTLATRKISSERNRFN